MAGGGGGPSPPSHAPPPAPTSGGEFLLQLLHKSPQTQTPVAATATTTAAAPPNPPPPSLPVDPSQQLDPAVAAVGPTIPFPPYPSQGHDLRGPWLNTFNPPYHPSFLPPGLPQNPWSVAGFSPPAMNGLDFHHSTHMRGAHPFYSDELQRLGLLSNTGVSGNPGYPPQQQNQPKKNMLMFGTLACEVQDHKVLSNGAPSDRHSKGAERENDKGQARFQKGHEVVVGSGSSNSSEIHSNFIWNSQLEHRFNFHGPRQGNYSLHEEGRGRVGRDRQQHSGFQRSVVPEQRRAPPGFAQKPIAKGQWGSVSGRQDLERNVGREETSRRELRHQAVCYVDEGEKIGRQGPEHSENCIDVSSGSRLIRQLDHPGPHTGSNLHSASASDIEESLASAHGEVVEWATTRLPREETRNRDGSLASGRQSSREQDDLGEELIGSLMLRDGLRQRNDVKKLEKSRDKESTLDIMRGQRVLNPRMRNFKRQVACRYDIERLNAPLLEIYESLIPAEEEKKKQKQLLTLLEKLVNKEWPKARLYIYGSCANSFGFSNSDIDVCLVIEDTEVIKSEILLKLADILQSDNLQDVQALTRARVPIVKLMDPVTGISGDICINNILAVVNTKLLRDYAQIDPRLRQLAFIVKHWAKSRRVNETYQGTLSSYAYVLMCIHFLQQRKPAILPCLQGMETTYAVTIDDVECAYFDQVENLCEFGSQNKESIAQLVWAFFDYWAYRHDYANAVISVRTGSIIR